MDRERGGRDEPARVSFVGERMLTIQKGHAMGDGRWAMGDWRWAIGDWRLAIGGDDSGVVTSTSLLPKPTRPMNSFRLATIAQVALASTLIAQQISSFTVGTASAAPGITAYGAIAIPAGSDSAL